MNLFHQLFAQAVFNNEDIPNISMRSLQAFVRKMFGDHAIRSKLKVNKIHNLNAYGDGEGSFFILVLNGEMLECYNCESPKNKKTVEVRIEVEGEFNPFIQRQPHAAINLVFFDTGEIRQKKLNIDEWIKE